MTRARSPTSSSTTRSSSRFSSSVVVGDSPVVPETTSPSQPASIRWWANCAAVSVSTEPSARNGVTIAVSTVPNRAGASNPTVLTVFRLPGDSKLFRTRTKARCRGDRRLRLRWATRDCHLQPSPADAGSGFGGQRAGRDLGPVGQGGDLEVGEHRGRRARQLTQALDGQPPDFHVGVLAGAHGDEVAPCPVVAGHDDAGFGRAGQHGAGGLTRLLTPQNGVRLVSDLRL